MPRYLSFRFDDGFIAGARTADALLGPDRASFFIVTGLVAGTHAPDHAAGFAGGDFGVPADWRNLARAGHDIQPHSVTHANLPTLGVEAQIAEAAQSLAFVRTLHNGPNVFCHPYNARTTLDFAALGFIGAGFIGPSGLGAPDVLPYNDLSRFDPFLLRSQVCFEHRLDWIIDNLDLRVPDNGWVILAFHSFDGEGFQPISSAAFARLLAAVRAQGYAIETVAGMLSRHA